MKAGWLAAAGAMLVFSALAQRPPLQEQNLPLPQVQSPGLASPNTVQALPAAPAPGDGRDRWLASPAAKLQALDKVNAQATTMTVKVGQSATFGSLTIAVKSCMVRPPDRPADAAAYLDVTDSHPDSPGFDGWLLANEPSVSMLQHPIYDIRVVGCT
jgi:hypothetical protein